MMVIAVRRFPEVLHALNPFHWEIPDRIEEKFQALENRAIQSADSDATAVRRRRADRITRRE